MFLREPAWYFLQGRPYSDNGLEGVAHSSTVVFLSCLAIVTIIVILFADGNKVYANSLIEVNRSHVAICFSICFLDTEEKTVDSSPSSIVWQ